MGQTEGVRASTDIGENQGNGRLKLLNTANSNIFDHISHKFSNFLKLKRLGKDVGEVKSTSFYSKEEKGPSASWEDDLEKQLQAWSENPSWEDKRPEIKVTVPKDTLSSLNVKVNVGLPPDSVYNIVIDPNNKRVFKNIKEVKSRKVLLDEGLRQVVEVEQAAIWRFLWWSGTISVHVLVDQNREDRSMKFKQLKTGFMKKFEGCWKVEPLFVDETSCFPFKPKSFEEYYACTRGKGRVGSRVSLEQLIQPAIVPPPPISWYLRGITTRTTEMLINDLLAEASRIRGGLDAANSSEELRAAPETAAKNRIDDLQDIKERWATRRRNARQRHQKLLTAN